jgi:hypothetical protein
MHFVVGATGASGGATAKLVAATTSAAGMSEAISGLLLVAIPRISLAHAATRCRLICLQRKRRLPVADATHWHDGQISKILSSPARKNIPLHARPKSTP